MSALAKIVLSFGKRVAGCDIADGDFVQGLKKAGVSVTVGSGENEVETYSAVVYTDAIDSGDITLAAALSLRKPVFSRGVFLSELARNYKKVIAIAGCHGKTTCTCMLAHVFNSAHIPFTFHAGGNDVDFSNALVKGRDCLITEACEYKRNFLYLTPTVAVVLNVAADHLDCYSDEDDVISAYGCFAANSELPISLYDGKSSYGVTFGFNPKADYCARDLSCDNGRYAFSVYEGENRLGSVRLSVCGKHNVLNALAAIAVARSEGIPFAYVADGLQSFRGVARRFERIGRINGVSCVADYAHHPDEIKATLKVAHKLCSGKLYVVFQPHTYSRTRTLFSSFVRVLSPLKNLLIYKTFAAREYFDGAGSALTLSNAIKKARYGETERDICDFLSSATEGDLILFLGAGDIYYTAKTLLD